MNTEHVLNHKTVIYGFLVINLFFNCHSNKGVETKKDENTTKLSIAQTLQEQENLPITEQIALYHKLKKENPYGYNFENEDEMTMYGYRHLWNNQPNDALEIFKLIVEEFPNSSNPYDSLGEAYLAIGDSLMSLKNYEISLRLNPENFNAEDQIERIKYPHRIPITSKEKFAKTYDRQAYIADLQQLGEKLLGVHPNALKFIGEADFWKTIEEKKSLITNNTTFAEFAWHCSEIIANINCSHTSMGSFSLESDMLPKALRFPIQTRLINGRLYVIDGYTNSDKVSVKDEIIEINHIPVSQLISVVHKHIQSQGYIETTIYQEFNMWSTVIIPYALRFPEQYTIKVKGKPRPIELNKANSMEVPYQDNSIPYCGKDLCLELNENKKTAVMTLYSFNYYPWNNFDEFKQFVDESFKKIKEKQVENLIIDLRFNGGGSAESSIYLLKYLSRKPFAYLNGYGMQQPFKDGYNGNLFFLMDGHGKSTTGHFMALAKELGLGTIVGEELGSNQFCTAGQTVLRLSSTKLVYYVANTTSRLADINLPDEKGILPDYTIIQNIDDYLNKVDTVKEFAFKLISDQD
ncbi:S41 family peptidase [Maribacter algicola]|uniref:S41 family peptidase n=1 Tax=Meishania litoralis TaxID=3434685 RepID=A0ACC7LJ09_9FLAO